LDAFSVVVWYTLDSIFWLNTGNNMKSHQYYTIIALLSFILACQLTVLKWDITAILFGINGLISMFTAIITPRDK